MIGNSVLEEVKRHTPHLREIQRPLVFTYFRTLASIFALCRPRIIYYIFSLSLIYCIVFVCYLFSKQVDFFNSCFFIPFILVFVSCTGWHFCETVSFSMVMVQWMDYIVNFDNIEPFHALSTPSGLNSSYSL